MTFERSGDERIIAAFESQAWAEGGWLPPSAFIVIVASHLDAGHPTIVYASLLSLTQYLSPLKDYPLLASKQYQRHGYTLDVYTFRFAFKS